MSAAMKDKFWEFKQGSDKKRGELLLYGQIASSKPWWSEDGEEFVIAKQFAKDLQSLGDIEELVIYLNSGGGDVFAGQAIAAMIKRHKAQTTCYIDGLAASIALNIPCACDKVIIPVNAMMMAHHPKGLAFGYYNAEEYRKMAIDLDKISESSIALYQEKTGLSREEIIEIMDNETWFTAEEAVNKGFADELEEKKQIVACIDGSMVMMGGLKFEMSTFKHFPLDKIQRVEKTKKEEKQIMDLTLEILQKEYPDIYKAAKDAGYKEGVDAERARMKAIDEIATPGTAQIVTKAKYETGATAEQVAMDIVKEDKQLRQKKLGDIQQDAGDAGNVPGGDAPPADNDAAKLQRMTKAFAKGANVQRS